MTRLAEALTYLGYKSDTDFLVRDDGNGPYLAEWHSSDPRPGEADIEAALAEKDAETEKQAVRDQLAATDAQMARVAEDMWAAVKTAMSEGRVPTDDDLPAEAREVISKRNDLRSRLRGQT